MGQKSGAFRKRWSELGAALVYAAKNNYMSTDFTIEFRGDYIYVRHAAEFEITPETTGRLWPALAVGCSVNDCRRVLINGKLGWRKSNWLAAYSSATRAMSIIQGLRVAYCFENYTEEELLKFFKMVASNRGVETEFFTDFRRALCWLGVENP
jgi:hypothetical protein